MKSVTYKAENGLEVTFDCCSDLLCEYLDTTSLQGVFATSTLLGSDGQVTTSALIGAKTVVGQFAVDIIDEDRRQKTLDYIKKVFNPKNKKNKGKLIVRSKNDYEIECRPSAVPQFKRDRNVSYIYRFDVDFVCDYPYFKQCGVITKPLVNGDNVIFSASEIDTPVEIYISDCTGGAIINLENANIEMLSCDNATVSTKTFTATDDSGNDVTNKINVSSNIEDFKLHYGKNNIFLAVNSGGAVLRYYYLTTGVI